VLWRGQTEGNTNNVQVGGGGGFQEGDQSNLRKRQRGKRSEPGTPSFIVRRGCSARIKEQQKREKKEIKVFTLRLIN